MTILDTRARRDRRAFENYAPTPAHAEPAAPIARPIIAGDPLAVLPPTSRARLADLRQTARDARAVADLSLDDVNESRLAMQRAEAHRRRVVDEHQARRDGDDHPAVKIAESDLARARDDLSDRQLRYAARTARWREAAAIVDAIENYVRQRIASPVSEWAGTLPPIVPPRGKTALDVLAQRRDDVARTMTALAAAREAPRTKAEQKAAALAEIDYLAAQGRPDLSKLAHRDGMIEWPRIIVGPQQVEIAGERLAIYQPPAVDTATPFVVWINRDTIAKRIAAELDAQPEQPGAMNAAARADAIKKLEAELLLAERLEAQAVEECRATGATTSHRHDADPRAVLGLADDAPKPA